MVSVVIPIISSGTCVQVFDLNQVLFCVLNNSLRDNLTCYNPPVDVHFVASFMSQRLLT